MGARAERSNSPRSRGGRRPRHAPGQQPVGADDLLGLLVDDEEVVAVRVEGVGVEAGLGPVQAGTELAGEDLVAQALGGAHLVLVTGQADGVARPRFGRGAGRRGGVPGGGEAGGGRGRGGGRGGGCGGRRRGGEGDGDRGAIVMAAPDPGTEGQVRRCVAWLLYFFRDRLDST